MSHEKGNVYMLKPVIDVSSTGKNLKQKRCQAGYSVAQLREMLQLETVGAIYKWECEKSMPTVDNLVILSSVYGIPIQDLIVVRKEEI